MSMTAVSRNRQRLAGLRLAAQRIGSRELSTPAEVVRWMLGLQAQDLPGVRWSIGVRFGGATESRVDAAFDAGAIVRSWPLRGTLHVVAAEDLGWLLELTAPRSLASAASRRAALGITDDDLGRARAAVESSLAGRRVLTRDALLGAIDAAGVSTSGQRGYHLLWHLAQAGTLVLGPTEGRQQAFALLDEWVRGARWLERDEALGELALRYFRSHGPATARDLARWSGLTLGEVRRGIGICGDRLTSLDLDGASYLLAAETLDAPGPPARVHLLPGFDEYVLGYTDRTAVLAPQHADAIVPGGNGMFRPTIVVDGEVVGTWGRTVRGDEIVVEPDVFGRLPASARADLHAAVAAYGSFRSLPARLGGALDT